MIEIDDLTDGRVIALLRAHLEDMSKYSPPGSIHALDEIAIKSPSLTFWSARFGTDIAGCGALKEISADAGEIKSMKTDPRFLRKGIARGILSKIIEEARRRNYRALYLETGAHEAFLPARSLYARAGFLECGPFANYTEDPHSVLFKLSLTGKYF